MMLWTNEGKMILREWLSAACQMREYGKHKWGLRWLLLCLMAFITHSRQLGNGVERVLAAVTASQRGRASASEVSFGVQMNRWCGLDEAGCFPAGARNTCAYCSCFWAVFSWVLGTQLQLKSEFASKILFKRLSLYSSSVKMPKIILISLASALLA